MTHAQVVDYSLPPAADLSIDVVPGTASVHRKVIVTNNRVGAHPGVEVRLVKVRIVEQRINEGARTTTWTVRNLQAGHSEEHDFYASIVRQQGDGRTLVPLRLHAEIIETEPVEPPGYQFNNADDYWKMAVPRATNLWWIRHTNGDAGVAFHISDRFPQAGGTTTFTVTATNTATNIGSASENNHPQLDVQVSISLSPGLSFSTTQEEPPLGTFDTNSGLWDIGTFEQVRHGTGVRDFPVSVNLTSDSLADLPLEERCMTAKVIRAVPRFEFDSSKRDNDIRTVCLGEQKVLVTGGDFNIFDHFQCVGVSEEPCTSNDTVELLAATYDPPQTDSRSSYFQLYTDDLERTEERLGRPTFLQPESFTVQVWERRQLPGQGAGSVWSTDSGFDLKGNLYRLPNSMWSAINVALTVTGPGGGPLPGFFWFTLSENNNSVFLQATDTTKVEADEFDDTGFDYGVNLEFGSLGTYLLTMDFRAEHSTAGNMIDSPTYTFHVGPAADLEVRDTGANPQVASSQRAYTVTAVNNGPQDAAGVEVALTGVPEGAEAFHGEGSYTERSCQSGVCEGVWTIGNLKQKDQRRAAPRTAGPTLTLVTAAGGSPITATIESTGLYTEVVDGASESGPYHDYDDDNNTVTVEARAGTATGEGAPGAPRSLSVQRHGGIAVLSWGEVARVHGYPVTHYHVERNGAIVAEDVMDDVYVDLQDVNQPYRTYRVRAVNQFGVPGPWSLPAGGAMTAGPGAPTGLTATPSEVIGRIVLSWFAPSADTALRYRIEHSRDGGGSWTVLSESHDGLTYTHDRLPPASTQFYRVATVKDGLTSAWVNAQAITKTEPGALASLTASTGRGVGRIDLSSYPPFAVGNLRYRIEHATDPAGLWTVLSASFNGLTYSHHGMSPGTTHYYRVAVVQDGVISAWTYAHATTEALPVLDEQGDTVHVVHYAPTEPENLRFTSVERTAVTLVWDAPVDDGGTPITAYEYLVSGPCASGADAMCDIVAPTRVRGTSVRVSGLNREGNYQFEVRALNAVGASHWSLPMHKTVGPATAAGGRVILSPSRLTVTEGGQATYRVRLSRSPTQPVWVILHWDGDEDLGGKLPFQQFQALLPSGYDTTAAAGASCHDHPSGYDWGGMGHAWNVGVPITVIAAEDDDSENGRMTIQHDLVTVPAECLGNPAGYAPDPVYHEMYGIALEVTERDND